MDEEDAWAAWSATKKQKTDEHPASSTAAATAATKRERPSRSDLQRDVDNRIDDPDYWRPPPKEPPPASVAAAAKRTTGALVKQGNRWVLASAVATSAVWNAPKKHEDGEGYGMAYLPQAFWHDDASPACRRRLKWPATPSDPALVDQNPYPNVPLPKCKGLRYRWDAGELTAGMEEKITTDRSRCQHATTHTRRPRSAAQIVRGPTGRPVHGGVTTSAAWSGRSPLLLTRDVVECHEYAGRCPCGNPEPRSPAAHLHARSWRRRCTAIRPSDEAFTPVRTLPWFVSSVLVIFRVASPSFSLPLPLPTLPGPAGHAGRRGVPIASHQRAVERSPLQVPECLQVPAARVDPHHVQPIALSHEC